MSPRLFWKSLVFWITILFGLVIVTAMKPGSEKWPDTIPFVIILPIALAQLWYVKRKQRANPNAYTVTPRARRTYLIANIVIFGLIAATNFLKPHTDGWEIGITVLSGVVVVISAYRLFSPPPTESS